MNPRGLAAVILLALSSTGLCRLGETFAECEARYGKAVEKMADSAAFLKDGIRIEVKFLRGKVGCIRYEKEAVDPLNPKPSDHFTDEDIQALLHANSALRWERRVLGSDAPGNKTWWTEDSSCLASALASIPGLSISTVEYTKHSSAKFQEAENKKLRDQSKLKGF